MDDVIRTLDGLAASGRYAELEALSRRVLAQHRYFLWHMYLIVALLRTGRRDEAGRELDELFSYKFNIADRAWPEIRDAFPEKFEQHFILSTMKPELGVEGGVRLRARWDVPCPIEEETRFGEAVDALIAESVPQLPTLERAATRVTTFGSCFAANLARMLQATGVDATNLLIEESINSPLANRAFLRGLAEPDAFEQTPRLVEVYGAPFLDRARAQLREAAVIVLTLGVAPAFFHRATGRFAFLEDYRKLLAEGAVVMRTPSVVDAKATIADVLSLIRGLNERARIYVSISPVPLLGSAEMPSAVVADCVSKSTLRSALHEVLREASPRDTFYWPSFEIVRWLGGHTTLGPFGADDQVSRHVSNWLVQMIVGRFSRHLFGSGLA